MSFKKDEFVSYLKSKGLKSARTYCSYLRRIEREFKTDIDAEYRRDACADLRKILDTELEKTKNKTKHREGQ